MKQLLLLFLLAESLFGIPQASAGSIPISTSLPGSSGGGSVPGTVYDLYNFSLLIGAGLAFAVIVYGGIRYALAAGSPAGQSEGREWIKAAILGLFLLLGAYVILNTISPGLVSLELPTLEQLPGPQTGPGSPCTLSCPSGNYCNIDVTGNPYCQPYPRLTGPGGCSVITCSCTGNPSGLAGCTWDAQHASGIIRAESGGNPFAASRTDKCKDGNSFSHGLFQINLTVHDVGGLSCPSAFSGRNYDCRVVNRTLYDQCVQAATNPTLNIQKACQIFKERQGGSGNGWNAWGANSVCRYVN